ncbi:YHS domain-containing protein [Algoriphagus persicinus]|uniref:YHS domain-containing protein n=1 Tax=Algoriphagus persicinus TaxID=3108754 RepID=UPI002B3E7B65|nr:YHS domain-containing protein [Algoriphagus sp. E1-3-M2]MEB2787194.1 YHS domain-containing protein [Algoriphagus sp. E1-3-M2]
MHDRYIAHRNLWLIIGISFTLMTMVSCATGRMPSSTAIDKYSDPVCGMKADTGTQYQSTYEGTTFYFDSEECLQVFNRNPGKFAQGTNATRRMGMGNGHMGSWGLVMGGIMVVGMTVAMIIGLNH